MGYDLHITRAEDWLESENNPIRLEEWIEYCRLDDEMRVDGFAEANVLGEAVLRVESEGLAVWTAYPSHDIADHRGWFDWRNGRIVVKNPDREIIGKMKVIAEHFSARVVGDEGEAY